jgi:hypothetical protein
MINKAMQTITAIVIPIVGTGCVLSAANNHLLSSGAPALSSRVALLSCEPNATNLYHCPQPPQNGPDGCPLPTAFNHIDHDICVSEQIGGALITGGPPIPNPFEPRPGPFEPGEIVPRIVEAPK